MKLRTQPDDESLCLGVARADSELWVAYVNANVSQERREECRVARINSASLTNPDRARAFHDVDLLIGTVGSPLDDEYRVKLKSIMKKHPIFCDEGLHQHFPLISLAGLKLDRTVSVAFSMFFLGTLDQEFPLERSEQSNKRQTRKRKK